MIISGKDFCIKIQFLQVLNLFVKSAVNWKGVFCQVHQDCSFQSVLLDKVVYYLIKTKIAGTNQDLKKKKVFRHTRQVSSKKAVGLHDYEEAAVLHHHDFLLLEGPLSSEGFAYFILVCYISVDVVLFKLVL